MAKIVIDTELNTKSFDRQIQKLKTDIERYMRVLEADAKVPVKFQMSQAERENIEITIEKLRNQLISLQDQAQKTGEVGEQAGERSGKGFEKGITSLKRFALGLFGVRSAFMVIRRATNAYLSENEVTANKMNAIWVALGNALGPIIELIANGVLKLIGYLNVFLNALGFKIDLTKNIGKNTKAIKNQTKAMKELNNQVAPFDEMNVVQKETSSSGGGGTPATSDAFEMPELNQDIVNFLQDTAKLLKENWDWISKILLLIGGIKIAQWLTGLGGITNALKIAATLGVVALGVDFIYDVITGRDLIKDIKDIKDGFDAVNKANKQNTKMNKENAEGTKELIAQKKEENKQYQKNSKELQLNFDYLRSVVEQEALENKELAERVDKMSGTEYWYERQIGTIGQYNERLADNNDTMRAGIQGMVDMYNAGQLNEEQEKKLFEILNAVNGTIKDGIVVYEDMDTHVLDASKHVGDYTDVVDASNRELEYTSKNASPLWKNISDVAGRESDRMERTIQGNWYDIRNIAQTEMNRINNLTATPKIKGDFNDLQNKLNKLGNMQGSTTFFGQGVAQTLARIKLASGGIIYNPGRGVALTSVVGGEATGGAEGVVPLNNEQSMDLIGQSIAKHLVVNLTNTTMLDSKVIAREQRRIEDENNFATNGRGVQ